MTSPPRRFAIAEQTRSRRGRVRARRRSLLFLSGINGEYITGLACVDGKHHPFGYLHRPIRFFRLEMNLESADRLSRPLRRSSPGCSFHISRRRHVEAVAPSAYPTKDAVQPRMKQVTSGRRVCGLPWRLGIKSLLPGSPPVTAPYLAAAPDLITSLHMSDSFISGTHSRCQIYCRNL
ncbi:hypothetical protein OPV22_023379 [Ensete ventricosum]|uniref:Uncharacterized protein n=1 Tax=Ensete ventricosum TaxID=4639 RepID=A0AAV8QLN7_ENSVE|nr:hypothetical protein OPV22_023379 [Ensete ventricosum]